MHAGGLAQQVMSAELFDKSSNVMVSLEDRNAVMMKIVDFGLANAANEVGSQSAILTPGGFAGTPDFTVPSNLQESARTFVRIFTRWA